MSTPPSNPADTTTPQPPAPVDADMDLAGTVDQLLADIDAAGKSLTQDMAADAPPPPTPADTAQPPAQPAVQPEISASNANLLAQVEALIQQTNAGTPPPPPPSAEPVAAEPLTAEPVGATNLPEPATAPVAQPPTAPAPSARAAEQSPSLKALDEEVSRLADEMLDQSKPASAFPQPSAPVPQVAVAPVAAPPAHEPEPEPKPPLRAAPLAGLATTAKSWLGSLCIAALAPLSAPLATKAPVVRQSVGWIACGSIFFAVVLWAVVLTRTPPQTEHASGAFDFEHGTPPALPVAHADPHTPAKDAHADAGHGEASGDHGGGGHDAKADAKKAKPTAKKPPRKNRAASQAKEEPPPAGHH